MGGVRQWRAKGGEEGERSWWLEMADFVNSLRLHFPKNYKSDKITKNLKLTKKLNFKFLNLTI